MHDHEGTTFTVRDARASSLFSILIVPLLISLLLLFSFLFLSFSLSSFLLHISASSSALDTPNFVILHYTQKQASCTNSLQFFS
jgi:hypothetical protein